MQPTVIWPVGKDLSFVHRLHPVWNTLVIDFQLWATHRQPGRVVAVNLTKGIIIEIGTSRKPVWLLDEPGCCILVSSINDEIAWNLPPWPDHGPEPCVFNRHYVNGFSLIVLRLNVVGDSVILAMRDIRSCLANPVQDCFRSNRNRGFVSLKGWSFFSLAGGFSNRIPGRLDC